MDRLLSLEPALVRSIASVVIIIGTNVGLNISNAVDGTVTVVLAILAVLPLIQGWWTRQAVTPNAAVVERVTPEDEILAGSAHDEIAEGTYIRSWGHTYPA